MMTREQIERARQVVNQFPPEHHAIYVALLLERMGIILPGSAEKVADKIATWKIAGGGVMKLLQSLAPSTPQEPRQRSF